jgi:Dolichyl-phosphate-mannose-protein mannosyltransferase
MTTATNRGNSLLEQTSSPSMKSGSLRGVIWLALAVRLALFPFAENKHADAPIRALIAERMNADPIAAADPRNFCQFGPLPILLLRPFLAVDPDARRSSRVLSFIAGLAVFIPFFALARRMIGSGPAVGLAGFALALSPLHVQVSTTAASEGLYLLLLVAALERLHAALSDGRRIDFILAGGLASLAAVTRYDTWLAVPVAGVAALVFGRRDRRAIADVCLFLGASAIFPAAYLVWSWSKSGDAFFFARYITADHAALAKLVTERLGGGLARLRQIGIWVVSFAAAMTPAAFLAMGVATRGWRQWSPATRVVMAMALAPPGAYIAKGLLLGNFEPLPRFAIAPGVVMLPLAASALLAYGGGSSRWWPRLRPIFLIAGGAMAISAVALALAFAHPGRISAGPESISPLTRLDGEDRALAAYLVHHRRPEEGVFIDTMGYADIAIAHAARVPAPLTATLSRTREPGATLAESRRLTDASWFAFRDDSWGRIKIPDWPAETQRYGRWRLAHVGDAR